MTPATLTDEEIRTELLVATQPRNEAGDQDGPEGGPNDTGDETTGGDADGTDGGSDADGTDGGGDADGTDGGS